MPVRSSVVGSSTPPHDATCDARWLMAYAAGLGLSDPVYLDTSRIGGVVAHPVFPVAPEWGLLTAPGLAIDYGLSSGEAIRGVHASHDLILHRPIHQGDQVAITATVAGVDTTRAGARTTLRIEAVDGEGERVWTTWFVSLFRGVAVGGDDRPPVAQRDPIIPAGSSEPVDQRSVRVSRRAAHIYTECARIWNPIHTDIAVATAAGLPGPILHGTATLAHGVSSTLEMIGVGPDAVRRLGGSFRAIVLMPSTLTAELLAIDETAEADRAVAHFRVRTEAGNVAVSNGYVIVATAGAAVP